MTALDDLMGWIEGQAMLVAFCFLRVSSSLFMFPMLGEVIIPKRIRLLISGALTFSILPSIPNSQTFLELNNAEFLTIGFMEIIIGLAIGATAKLIIYCLYVCGSFIAQMMSISQIFGVQSSEASPVMGQMLVYTGLAALSAQQISLNFIHAQILLFDLLPIGQTISVVEMGNQYVLNFMRCFQIAFALAAPFVVVSLIYNLALGAINRAMPQFMAILIGTPVIVFCAILLFTMLLPLMITGWLNEFTIPSLFHGALNE